MNIPYGKQQITQADLDAVTETLQADFLTQGPKIAEFEKKFAEYTGAKYAVALSNGTAALHLGALALGTNESSKVISTPITFAASTNSILYCGGQVEFCDVDPNTGLLDINEVRKKLENAPKGTYSGVIPVDFAGKAVDLEQYRQLADEYDLWLIEDACHAPGGYFIDSRGNKQNCGNGKFADLTVFSFHPVKHIACGEGGMITTNDKALYDQLMMIRTHGITKREDLLTQNDGGWYYEMHELGYNYRITDIQAALGVSQLSRADEGIAKRRRIAATYDKAFHEKGIKTLDTVDEGHAFHLYIVLVQDRKGLYDHLRSKNIFAQVHYIPVHLQPYYKNLGCKKGDFPNSEAYYEQCLSLPMYPTLTSEEQQFVIDSVLEFVHE